MRACRQSQLQKARLCPSSSADFAPTARVLRVLLRCPALPGAVPANLVEIRLRLRLYWLMLAVSTRRLHQLSLSAAAPAGASSLDGSAAPPWQQAEHAGAAGLGWAVRWVESQLADTALSAMLQASGGRSMPAPGRRRSPAGFSTALRARGERLPERLLENPTFNSIFERLSAELSIEKHVLHDFIVGLATSGLAGGGVAADPESAAHFQRELLKLLTAGNPTRVEHDAYVSRAMECLSKIMQLTSWPIFVSRCVTHLRPHFVSGAL
ncbi:hypothetical protein T492DRAFT_872742 [Pavlovales sp. CCMP2436]|nr:hypothetical protein T492DRAFT_872742 [Pavlovales sp. CCMP2436]